MSLCTLLGLGHKKLTATGVQTTGTVTEIKTCWWLKINTKPVRAHMWDGALFPHRVNYRYTVDGKEYQGKRIISPYAACPKKGDALIVFYHPERSSIQP